MARRRRKPRKRKDGPHAGNAWSTEGSKMAASDDPLTTIRRLFYSLKIADLVSTHFDDLGKALDWLYSLIEHLLEVMR